MRRRRKVDMDNIPSNNIFSDQLEPMELAGSARRAVGPKSSIFANTIRAISNSIFADIILPAIQTTVSDSAKTFIDSLIYKKSSPSMMGARRSSHSDYNRRYRSRSDKARRQQIRRYVSEEEDVYPTFDDVYFDNVMDASNILHKLKELIDIKGYVTISDYYKLLNISANLTQRRWGWEDLYSAQVISLPNGYLIDFPEPLYFEE